MLDEFVQNFHFLRPYWLIALIGLIIVIWMVKRSKVYSKGWQSVCDARLLPFILSAEEGKIRQWPLLLFGFISVLTIVALAGPVWKKLPQPVFRDPSALVIALDLSKSMDAADIKPSRLARARLKIIDILNKRKEGQVALLVFAQEAFVVSPLTEDAKTIESLVGSLSTNIMPNQGSRPDVAVTKALALFQQSGANKGDILLVTDGISDDLRLDELTKEADNYPISVLGVGTERGAPIPLRGGSFLKDINGAIVIPKLEEQRLQALASQGGGRYSRLLTSDNDIDYIVPSVSRKLDSVKMQDQTEMKMTADVWREEGPWILLIVIPIAALAFRRGFLVLAVFIVLLPLPKPAYALDWQNFWRNTNQQAAVEFAQGNNSGAAKKFTDNEWRAAAYYRAQEFEKSLQALGETRTAMATYNKANALAKLGKLPEAIDAYKQALDLDPEHEDAKYNKKILEDFLKQQEQENKNSQQSESDESTSDDSQSQESQNQNSQNQDQSEESSKQQNIQSNSENQQGGQSQRESADQQNRDEQESQQSSAQEQAKDNQDKKQEQISKVDDQKESNDEDNEQRQASLDNTRQFDPEMLEANEQWLRRIPDDPGGLLRRKFRYQSKLRRKPAGSEIKAW